jgi:hypothetical protein
MIKLTSAMFVLLVAGVSAAVIAQTGSPAGKWHFQSVNTVGWLHGKANNALQLQTVNGFRRNNWFVGIGTGVDNYQLRSIPLFLDARKDWGRSRDKFFLYADAGINWYWKRDGDPKSFYVDNTFSKGFYGETGAGYKCSLNRQIALVFSAGYSYKQLTEKGSILYYTDLMFPPDPGNPTVMPGVITTTEYRLTRLVFKIGIVF